MATTAERIAKIKEQQDRLKEKQAKLKAKEKQLLARENAKARKERTHLLIEFGGIVSKVFGEPLTKEMLPRFEEFLRQQDERGKYFTKAMKP